ncbi:MAG: hypothetical protein KKC05_03010, partial [Nanoarchaeota archaeon]|nr:hypothetical protein [Nanoarchaeota archaeon]
TTNFTVNVTSNPVVNRTEDYLNSSVGDGTEETVGNFTVWSTGNEQLTNIEFNVTGLENFTFEFIPSSISSLTEGASYPVQVNVTVPLGHFSGIYTGTINISTDNADFITLDVNITVLENTTWMASPTECIKVEIPDVGSVCNVSINNTGNVEINFTVIPAADNESYAEYNNFSIPANGSFILEILYNVSGDAKITYNTLYNITPTQNATPENITINVTLAPFIQPDLLAYVTPNRSTENSTVVISVNVTDRTDLGINWTQATIIRPDNSIDVLYLNRTNTSGNQSYWSINYPYNSSIGNTTQRGIYNVSIMANDTTGASNISNTTFVIHIEMNPSLLTQSTEYFQGGTGTIYYKLVDLYSDGIVANVTVNITDPNGNVTFQETYQTDALGMINPQPQFTVSSDAILGDYVVRARAVYFDNFTNETLVSISNTSFEVLAASTGGGMFADLETAVNWFPNNIIQFSLQVYDSSGALLDPDAMNLTVYDPADNLYFNITMSDMTRESTGFYTYDYAMPTSTATGAYLAVLEVDKASLSTQKLKAFRVVSGGPFDLRITLLENEVYLGDYLDFQITMINMGELSQDVILEFWVTDSSNATWSYSSEAIYTSSLTNQTVTRSSFIFSGQSLGLHTLNARLTFDSVQPAVTSNVTFEIIQTTNVTLPEIPAEIITIGGGGTGPSSVETEIIPFDHTYNISIIAHPPQLSLVKGWIGLETITVKNTGDIELNNITLVLIGLPSPWVNIKTKQIDKLNPAETGVFEVEFNIPKGAEVRDYDLTWLVVADYAVAEENSVLTIFNSQADLLKEEIKKLKEELAKLKIETKFAEDIGKDVTSIYTVLEEITSQIAQAEVNLDNELFDESTDNIVTASRLIEEAKQLLAQAPFLTTFTIEAIPFMYIIIIVVILIGINAFLLVWIKGLNRDVGRLIRPNIKKVRELVGIKEKKDESDEIAKSKKKIMGIIDILEKEYEEGVISKPTYEELVKTHKKRLKELNKKNR